MAAEKYCSALPCENRNASSIVSVATAPDSRLTVSGVPKRAENRPSARGPAPS